MRHLILRYAVFAGLALWAATGAAQAQLVIDGEIISSAKTFEAGKKEGRLLAYGIYPSDSMTVILKAFEADTGVKSEFIRLPTPAMFARLNSEFAANKLEADYVDLSDLTLIQQVIDRGILNAPHKVPAFDQIPAELREPNGRWYGVIRPIGVIAVNLSRVKEADIPKSWKDLLDPKWKGLIGTTSIDAGGSTFTLDAFLREKVDPQYWNKLATLSPRVYPTIAPLSTDLARGEIAIGIGSISEPVLAQKQAGAPLRVIFPTEGISSFPTAAGVSTTAKRPNAAALLLDWLTSRRGGKVIAQGGAYPANPQAGSPQAEGLTYPPQGQVWNIKSSDWINLRDSRMKEWREIFGTK